MRTMVHFAGIKQCKHCEKPKAMKETDPPGTCYIRCCGEIQSEWNPVLPGLHKEYH